MEAEPYGDTDRDDTQRKITKKLYQTSPHRTALRLPFTRADLVSNLVNITAAPPAAASPTLHVGAPEVPSPNFHFRPSSGGPSADTVRLPAPRMRGGAGGTGLEDGGDGESREEAGIDGCCRELLGLAPGLVRAAAGAASRRAGGG